MPNPEINEDRVARCDSCRYTYDIILEPVCPECGTTNPATRKGHEPYPASPRVTTGQAADMVRVPYDYQLWSVSLGGANRSWVLTKTDKQAIAAYIAHHYKGRYADLERDRGKIKVTGETQQLPVGSPYLHWRNKQVVKSTLTHHRSAA